MCIYVENNNSVLERICPICEKGILFGDFLTNDSIECADDIEDSEYYEKCRKVWDNPILAIPCCRCNKLIENIIDMRDRCKKDYVEIHKGCCIKNLKLENLKKFGVVE